MSDPDLKAIEQFLYREAALLDQPDLDSWVALFTEDGSYWIPAAEGQSDPLNHVSHIYDDRVMMEIRRRNFVHPRAASKEWPVRCSHLLGNIRLQGRNDAGDLVVTANFHVIMWYREEQRCFAGTSEHHLVPAGDDYRIRHKRVNLINPEAAQQSMIIYL